MSNFNYPYGSNMKAGFSFRDQQKKVLGENVKRFREQLGISQDALWDRCRRNLDASEDYRGSRVIAQIEKGNKWPGPKLLSDLATALNVTTNQLCTRRLAGEK